MYTFTIPIGDWSDDGHGKQEIFTATATAAIGSVREAFFKAQKLYPKLDPTSFANQYENNLLPEEVYKQAQELGFDFDNAEGEEGSRSIYDWEEMARYTAFFINLGDSDLNVTIMASSEIPSLTFYGHDKKGRHISYIGYGLFN